MNWENHFEKNSDQKNKKKNRKSMSKCRMWTQKNPSKKAHFRSNTVFTLKFEIRAKKFHATKPLAFSLDILVRRDQSHYTTKIMKMCEHILKKDSAPIQFKFFELLKTTISPIIIAIAYNNSYRFAAIKNQERSRTVKMQSSEKFA